MHYLDNETIMSFENALTLKPNEITILDHVRTYEGEDEERLPYFVEIRCLADSVVVRKNRILDFPLYELEEEQLFPNVEAATEIFRKWIRELLAS